MGSHYSKTHGSNKSLLLKPRESESESESWKKWLVHYLKRRAIDRIESFPDRICFCSLSILLVRGRGRTTTNQDKQGEKEETIENPKSRKPKIGTSDWVMLLMLEWFGDSGLKRKEKMWIVGLNFAIRRTTCTSLPNQTTVAVNGLTEGQTKCQRRKLRKDTHSFSRYSYSMNRILWL